MRTKTLLLSAAALVAGVIASQAQSNVYSANVVGYINRSLVPGNAVATFSLVANHLASGNDVLTNLLQSLPVNSKVLKWDPVGQAFVPYTRVAFGAGWSPTGSGTNTLALGEAAFVQLPSTATAGFTNTFVGQVFQADGVVTAPFTNTFAPNYSFQSFPVPVSLSVTSSVVNLNAAIPAAPAGSKMLQWNEGTQAYVPFTRTAFGSGWSPSVPVVNPGVGFFIFNAASTNRTWVSTFQVQ